MAILKPTFSLTVGSLSSDSDNPAGGPRAFLVERDMDVPADALRIDLADRSDIALGDDVSLELGHDGDNQTAFTGKVVRLQPALSGVTIFALGTMNDLLNYRSANTYESQTAGAIVQDLVGGAGLEAGTVDDGPTLPRFAVDRRVSAYVHVKGLADRLGYELYADRDGKVMFHALGDAAGLDAAGGGLLGAVAGAVSSLLGGGSAEGYAFGKHVIAGSAHSSPPAWGSVQVGSESPMSSQGDSASHWLTTDDSDFTGSAGSGDPQLLLLDLAARSKDLADRFAAGRLAVAKRTAHQVSFTVLGRPQVDLGDDLNLSDVPDATFNGQGYVRAIRHRFNDRAGFVTEFRISLSPEGA
jgi:phage protein D